MKPICPKCKEGATFTIHLQAGSVNCGVCQQILDGVWTLAKADAAPHLASMRKGAQA
jgi:uncharacterized protein (DUF983 family)